MQVKVKAVELVQEKEERNRQNKTKEDKQNGQRLRKDGRNRDAKIGQ